MTMTLKEGRQALHTAVVALLDGQGIEAADIKAYRTAFFSDSPTQCVMGTLKAVTEAATASEAEAGYHYFVQLLARYSDEASQAAAEDALDDLTELLVTGLLPHLVGQDWEMLDLLPGPDRNIARYGSSHYLVQEVRVRLRN